MSENKNLKIVRDILGKAKVYQHAAGVLQYDQETICPPAAMEEQGDIGVMLSNQADQLLKSPAFIQAIEDLAKDMDSLDPYDAAMVRFYYRDLEKNRHITADMQMEFDKVYNRGFVAWLKGKKAADYSLFAPVLNEITQVEKKRVELSNVTFDCPYDFLLDTYETGVTSADLDLAFGAFKDRMVDLLKKIQASPKKIRTDFLFRPVSDEAQRKLAYRLMDLMGLDPERIALSESEHPFTDGYSYNDVRITTHYYPDNFISSMYSVIHEGGHALFEQYAPKANHDHFLNDKTMGQHESVSRFYENLIGRSKGFAHLIYPELKEIFPELMADVTEEELYLALNTVQPSLIRTEADEFTYTFHVIIRYEIEKGIMDGTIDVKYLRDVWNQKYQEYLGITPDNDRVGVLQDMHWSSGYGYFPTYALGNFYNSMYFNAMNQEFDVDEAVANGHMDQVLTWMRDHVFARADQEDPKDWIRNITGRDFTPDDFLDYLEAKYSEIYEL